MPDVCMYFQVHQPDRLRRYSVFDIGNRRDYFDDSLNKEVLLKVSDKCYRPMNALLLEAIRQQEGRFRVAFSITCCVLDQMERWAPDVLDSFRALAATGCVEFLGETSKHSLSFLVDRNEFDYQVQTHRDRMQSLFGQTPRIFRNTELIYRNDLAAHLSGRGFQAIIAEGVDRILQWRSPNFVYCAESSRDIKLLLKNYRLSDDIAFRFGDRGWSEYPLRVETYADWLGRCGPEANSINLFMDYETFGEHQWADTGIFDFMRQLPTAVLERGMRFRTPSEVAREFDAAAPVDMPDYVSWADTERDLTAWYGNSMQRSAMTSLYSLREAVLSSPDALDDWRRLTTSDHFYYMCTKYFADGDVHKYFSPYESPYEAYITFMNVMADLAQRSGYSAWVPAA